MLYKYYSCETYNLEALANGYLWFSNPKKLNDPFDCNFDAYIESEHIDTLKDEYKQKLISQLNKLGICSFSQEQDNQHFWSLYAKNYSGFCLVFDKNIIDSRLGRLGIILGNTEYQTEVFDVITYFSQQQEKGADFKTAMERSLRTFAFSKNKKVWETENEVRALLAGIFIENPKLESAKVIFEGKGYKVHFKDFNALKQIILGHNMSSVNKELILNIVKHNYPDIKISKVELDYKNWELKIVDLIK